MKVNRKVGDPGVWAGLKGRVNAHFPEDEFPLFLYRTLFNISSKKMADSTTLLLSYGRIKRTDLTRIYLQNSHDSFISKAHPTYSALTPRALLFIFP